LSAAPFLLAAAAAESGPVVGLGGGRDFDQDTVEIHDWSTVAPGGTTRFASLAWKGPKNDELPIGARLVA
jgi:hypothetical protein